MIRRSPGGGTSDAAPPRPTRCWSSRCTTTPGCVRATRRSLRDLARSGTRPRDGWRSPSGSIVVAGSGPLPEGHDLLPSRGRGRGLTTAAALFAVGHFDAEPQQVVGHGSGSPTSSGWPRSPTSGTATVDETPEPIVNWRRCSRTHGPGAARRVTAAAAACVAQRTPPVQAPTLGDEPVQRLLLDRAEVPVWGRTASDPGRARGAGRAGHAAAGLLCHRLGWLRQIR